MQGFKLKVFILIINLLILSPLFAQTKTDGITYSIGGYPMIDPSSDEGNVIYFFIEGPAAKKIYESVENANIVSKYCNEENLIAKINNDFVCVLDKTSKKYKCHFALRFKDMKVVNALSC